MLEIVVIALVEPLENIWAFVYMHNFFAKVTKVIILEVMTHRIMIIKVIPKFAETDLY